MTLATGSVAGAFAFSLLLHALLFLTIETGFRAGIWKARLYLPADPVKPALQSSLKERVRPPEEEMPLVFLDVDPSQAVAEQPREAKYYSALNSQAANPDPTLDTTVPKVDGEQERVPQTIDKSRPEPQPLQPASEPAPEPPPDQAPERPRQAEPPAVAVEVRPEPGDLAMTKPLEKPRPEKPVERPPQKIQRARTLEAARRQKGIVAGEKMKQEGGVKRFGLESSFDVKATPFGSYDAAIIAAIQKRWYDLLGMRDFANHSGRVVLEFRLNSDGRVTEMKVSDNDVTEILALLCQRAVQDPAPFGPWPADLKRLVGKDYREVRFTFYYN